MGLYKKTNYVKDKNGNWHIVKCEIENAPHDVGAWLQNRKLERKSVGGEKTSISIESTKSGMNQKVVRATTKFGENEKTVRKLLTTSNKLPQRYKDEFSYLPKTMFRW